MMGALWLLTAGLVLALRSRGRGWLLSLGRGSWTVLVMPVGTLALLAMTTVVSIAALPLSMAVAVPRIRWKTVEGGELLASSGDSWRKLRGPAVPVVVGGIADVGVPTIDKEGKWVLFGILSGRAIEGLPPAEEGKIAADATRICEADGGRCRGWPASWPRPKPIPASQELTWSGRFRPDALAHEVESGLFLLPEEEASSEGGWDLEVLGHVDGDSPREPLSVVLTVRRVSGERLSGARIVAVVNGAQYAFHLQRVDVSLSRGPLALRYVARPVILLTSLALPVGLLLHLLAPVWFLRRLKRQGARRRELGAVLDLVPIEEVGASGMVLCRASNDADLGDALLMHGTVVSIASPGRGKEPIVSQTWFELPTTSLEDVLETASAVRHDERGSSRKVGALVPGDPENFRRAAAIWMGPWVSAMGMLAVGIAAVAPAVVALVTLWSSR